MLRRCGVATCAAAWRRAVGVLALLTTSERVRPAPNEPFKFLSEGTPFKDTRIFGVWWRRFMFGSRSVPPAMSIAAGPSPARICAASATERGVRCSNHGSRSTLALLLLALLAFAAFLRRGDKDRFRIGDGWKMLRPHPGGKAFRLELQGLENLVRRHRDFVD